MAIVNKSIQYPSVVFVEVTNSDWAAAIAEAIHKVPPKAQVVGGDIVVETVFNSTTNTVSVGDSGSATRYASAVDLKAAARTALTLTGYKYTTATDILATYAQTGTAPTQGKARIAIHYIVLDRGHEVET